LKRQTTALQQQLDAARQKQGTDAAAWQRAHDELVALQQQRAALPPQPSEAELHAVEERRQRVLRMIDDL
jgi:hypothetical protein